MHALIVITHPVPQSFTHHIAHHIAGGVMQSNATNSFEFADLAAEAFDPRFTQNDIAVHLKEAALSEDIVSEQARIDRADALVLVYPVYWWSMPGLLKGWIDRVFTNGWAYDEGPDAKLVKKLGHLQVHLVAIGGAGVHTYARHGYFGAMKTQIDHGILGYCGATVKTSELILPSTSDHLTCLETARDIGHKIFASTHKGNKMTA